jgi:hypothetical protein
MLWLTAALSDAAAQSTSPGAILASRVEIADEITIRHVPYYVSIRGTVSEDHLRELWSRSITLRCDFSCKQQARRLAALLRDSVMRAEDCPRNYRFEIEARSASGEVLATAYGDASWRCVQTNHGALILRSSMIEFLTTDWPPRFPEPEADDERSGDKGTLQQGRQRHRFRSNHEEGLHRRSARCEAPTWWRSDKVRE